MPIKINGVDSPSTVNIASDSPKGAYGLAEYPNLYEVQRTNNFEFIVSDMDDILRAGAQGDESNAHIENAQDILRLSVVSTLIPHFTQNVIQIRRGNSMIKAAGVPTFTSGNLVVNDYIGVDTKAVLMAWQNLSYNVRTDKVGLMGDYKKTATLVEYTPDYQIVRKWILYGCWISGLSEDSYNNENNEKHQITATIEYDKAVIDMSESV